MNTVPGINIINASSAPSHWLNPLSSPTIVLATSSVVALLWAFQQHGWAYCIPCVFFIAKKITGLRFLSK